MARQARLRSTPLDAAHLRANATQRQAVRVISGGFCVCASPYFVAKDGRIDTTQPKVLCATCSLRGALQPSVLWATSISDVYIFELVASLMSGFGTKRQLLRCNDMSGVGCTPEVTGTRPKCRF